MLRKYYIKDG